MNTEKLLDICRHRAFTQTEYQNKNFVINSQLTPLKKVRQCIMEISMREEAVREKDQSLRKLKWKMQERQEAIDAEKSIPKKEMMKIEFEKFDYEYIKYKHQYDMAKKDLDNFVEIMQNLIKEYDIDLANIDIDNEEEDRKYWLIRMAKNCAVDIISTGRIRSVIKPFDVEMMAIPRPPCTFGKVSFPSYRRKPGRLERLISRITGRPS